MYPIFPYYLNLRAWNLSPLSPMPERAVELDIFPLWTPYILVRVLSMLVIDVWYTTDCTGYVQYMDACSMQLGLSLRIER